MSIDLLIAFAAGFAAGGILLWVIARLAAQKEILHQTDEIRRSLSARVTELEGPARSTERRTHQPQRPLYLS